jgi:LysM repeat protein
MVNDVYQDGYCLRYTYAQCPVFQLKQQLQPQPPAPKTKASAEPRTSPLRFVKTRKSSPTAKATPPRAVAQPQKTLPPQTGQPGPAQPPAKATLNTRQIKDKIITGLMGGGIMAILLAVILIVPAYGPQLFGLRQGALPAGFTPTAELQSGLISHPTVAVPTGTDTATPTLTRTATATRTTPTVTRTLRPTRTATLSQRQEIIPSASYLPTTCGIPYGWSRYTVQPGDTLTSISQRTNTSVSQLQIANCMGYSTLIYAGMTLYVPFVPAPVYPTQPSPTSTTQPSPVPSTSTPVPTNTPIPAEPSSTPVPPTVEPSPVPPSATPVSPESSTNARTLVGDEIGGVI